MRTVLRVVLRVLFASVALAAPLAVAPPASALSCVGMDARNTMGGPAAIVGRVLAVDLDAHRLTLRVDEVLKGGPFPERLEVPGDALEWDDWTSPAMREGPVLFSLHEREDGVLGTGACSFSLDRAIIDEARALAEASGSAGEPTAGTTANPRVTTEEASSDRGFVVIGVLTGALVVLAATGLLVRRRVSPARGT